MVAVFKQELFHFDDDTVVPDHVDDFPANHPIDRSKYRIEGYIPEDGDYVWVASNLLDPDVAEMMLAAAIKRQQLQGESPFGVAIVGPDAQGIYRSIDNILPSAAK
jgi:hypothetical protein